MKLLIDARTRIHLTLLHKSLLRLHKVLLDDERKAYEAVHGAVEGSGPLLNLVMYDPWFDWLHRISETVVKIDELLEHKEGSYDAASDLLTATRQLFQTGGDESPFMTKYKASLKRDPGVVIAHIDLQKALLPDA
jgi:hypothetical protein